MTRRVPWPVFVLVPALMFAVGPVPPEVGAQTWNPSSSALAEAEDSRLPIVALATRTSAAANQPPGWNFDVHMQMPANVGQEVNCIVVSTVTTSAETEVNYAFRLLLPDGEEMRWQPEMQSYSKSMQGARQTETFTWGYAEAGPYVGRVVSLNGTDEALIAEASGWLGSADVPVVVLETLRTDPPAPHVGEPTTVSVTVTNHGQTPGSRRVDVRLWLDDAIIRLGSSTFDAVAPGETRTQSFEWTPRQAVTAKRLEASTGNLATGLVLEPYVVAPADTGPITGPDQPSNQTPEDTSGAADA
jgi:hypothetical protein